jgi:hypothetical protein
VYGLTFYRGKEYKKIFYFMKHRLLFREEKKFSIGLSENFLLSIGLSEIGLLFQKFFRERGDPPEKIFCITFSGVSETRKDENNLQLHHRI